MNHAEELTRLADDMREVGKKWRKGNYKQTDAAHLWDEWAIVLEGLANEIQAIIVYGEIFKKSPLIG